MNKKQRNYFRMFIGTQELLDNHTADWSSIVRVTAYKNDLDEIIVRIITKSDDAHALLSVGNRKDTLKRHIAIKGSSLSGALTAFAYDQGDLDLVDKVKESKSSIGKMKDEDRRAYIKTITDTAEKNLRKLADFGVSLEIVTELKTTMDEYQVLGGKPRSILNTKYVAVDAIDALIDAGNKLLNNKMDNIMLMFRETYPDFYNEYERARTIVDR